MKILILLILTKLAFSQTLTQSYISKAVRENGELAYIEKTSITYENNKIKSIVSVFLDPLEKEFAKSEAKFDKHTYLPNFEFNDSRMEKKEGLVSKDSKVELFHKEDQTSSLEQKLFEPDDSMVVIQGFPAYIMENTKEFSEGKSKKIRLLLPSMMKDLSFDVESVSHDLGPDFLKLNINISNWFIKLFTDRIEIVYNKKLNQQVSYYGITVIRKPNGGNEKYKITYQYL